MSSRSPRGCNCAVIAAAAALLIAAIPALRAEEHSPSTLPGVEGQAADQARIRPLGEPVAEMPEADANGFVRIGDWDVKISGSFTIDIGTFAPRTGR